MNKKKLSLVLFMLPLLNSAFAQRDSIRVRVFDGSGTELHVPKTKREMGEKNFINLSLYLLGRGAFVMGYEHAFTKHHAIVFDAGITYRDFIYESFNETLEDSGSPGFGHYFSLNYKWYPKDYYDFDGGIFVSPGIIDRTYNINYDVEYYNGSTSKTMSVNGSYTFRDYSLKFGYVMESWVFDDLIGELYFGAGLREATRNYYEIDSSQPTNKVIPTKEVKQTPSIYLGFKLGMVF